MNLVSNFLAIAAFIQLTVQKTVVIDCGTGFVKAGYAGDALPSVIVPNVVGKTRWQPKPYVGQEALDKEQGLKMTRPMKDGFIYDSEAMQTVLEYIFEQKLKANPSQGPVIMTYAPTSSSAMIDDLRSLMMNMGAPSVEMQNTALMTLKFAGLRTGLVIETGYAGTFVVPIYEGEPINSAIQQVEVAGNDITLFLMQLLRKEGLFLTSYGGIELVDDFKQKHCFVTMNVDNTYAAPVYYETQWGEDIAIIYPQFEAPELLFDPSLNRFRSDGLLEGMVETLANVESSIVNELYANVVLGGGNSLFKGLKERIQSDFSEVMDLDVNVIALDDREYSAWIGASKVSA